MAVKSLLLAWVAEEGAAEMHGALQRTLATSARQAS
jgi:hypothetical protein